MNIVKKTLARKNSKPIIMSDSEAFTKLDPGRINIAELEKCNILVVGKNPKERRECIKELIDGNLYDQFQICYSMSKELNIQYNYKSDGYDKRLDSFVELNKHLDESARISCIAVFDETIDAKSRVVGKSALEVSKICHGGGISSVCGSALYPRDARAVCDIIVVCPSADSKLVVSNFMIGYGPSELEKYDISKSGKEACSHCEGKGFISKATEADFLSSIKESCAVGEQYLCIKTEDPAKSSMYDNILRWKPVV